MTLSTTQSIEVTGIEFCIDPIIVALKFAAVWETPVGTASDSEAAGGIATGIVTGIVVGSDAADIIAAVVETPAGTM